MPYRLSVGYAKIQPQLLERKQMTLNGYTYKVGDLFTTLKSKKTGIIKEIVPNASGSVRVLLELPTKETRWTTISSDSLA
jgi:hypothetical protein